MTRYQRISPIYEAVKYEPGMESGFDKDGDAYLNIIRGQSFVGTNLLFTGEGYPPYQSVILTNTANGERSVITQKEFEREFRRVEG